MGGDFISGDDFIQAAPDIELHRFLLDTVGERPQRSIIHNRLRTRIGAEFIELFPMCHQQFFQ